MAYDDPDTGQRMIANLEAIPGLPNEPGPGGLQTRLLDYFVVELSGERTYVGRDIVVNVEKDTTVVRQS